VWSRQILLVRRVFAQIATNLPDKNSKEIYLQKKNDCIFSNQGTSSTIFAHILPKPAQISPNFPEKRKFKT